MAIHSVDRCGYGTCDQPALYRLVGTMLNLPLCPYHRRRLEARGSKTERISEPVLVAELLGEEEIGCP